MTPHVSWLGRMFGWSGSRSQWLTVIGVTAWLVVGGLLAVKSQYWTIGSTLLAFSAWLMMFGLAARDAVRDLFGPVFFYDLLRVSRNSTTFLLRGFYVVCLGAFLLLMYYEWMLAQSRYDSRIVAQMLTFTAAVVMAFSLALFLLSRKKLRMLFRLILLIGGIVVGILVLFAASEEWAVANRSKVRGVEILPTSVISRFATEFFEAFVIVQWIVLTLLTPVYVAGTIAVEKERKTLEFLLATDLRNREIIFGKLASRVLTLVMYVFAGLPLIAFLQLFGGIDPEQLLAATTATLVTVLGLAALSIWVSTTLKKARDAIVLTYLMILVYGFVTFIVAALAFIPVVGWWNTPVTLFGVSLGFNDIASFLADGNPFWAFFKLGPMRGGSVGSVLRDFVIFWSLAIVLLLGSAILRLRSVTLAQAYGPVTSRTKSPMHPKAEGSERIILSESSDRPPLTGNPVTWKEVFVDATFRGGCLGRIIAILIVLLAFAPLGMIIWFEFIDVPYYRYKTSFSIRWNRFTEEINGWVRVVTGVLGSLMFIAATIRGAGAITVEKDRDSWISLLSTPLSAEEILWGKWWGCVFSLRRAFFVLLMVWCIGLALGAVMPGMMLVMLPLTAIYVSAFSWVGLYCSLTARTTLIASVRAFFAALFCAGGFWIVLGLCCFMPLNFIGSRDYKLHEQLLSFFLGFTPPVVYGVFPLGGFNRYDLGPFNMESDYSAGLAGPILGTLFWILFNFMMNHICRAKCRTITNRGVRHPEQSEPDRRDSSETVE